MISVIIPFYNSEKYIDNCIKMLQNQSFTNFEAIFINDGSTDHFEKHFVQNDQRIILLTQEKKGVSAARNKGIESAKGQYITFLDVDDEYENNFLEEMYNSIRKNKCDIVICNYKEIYSLSTKDIILPWKNELLDNKIIKQKFIPQMIGSSCKDENCQIIRGLVWRNIVQKEFLIKSTVKFDENVPIAEDLLFLLELYSKADKIYILDKVLYRYNRFSGTTLDKYNKNQLEKQKYLHEQIIKILKKECLFVNNKERYQLNRLKMYTSLLSNSVRNPNKQEIINELKDITNFFKKDIYFKNISLNISFVDKINIFLMKHKFNYLLYLIYSTKEKIRRKKLK